MEVLVFFALAIPGPFLVQGAGRRLGYALPWWFCIATCFVAILALAAALGPPPGDCAAGTC